MELLPLPVHAHAENGFPPGGTTGRSSGEYCIETPVVYTAIEIPTRRTASCRLVWSLELTAKGKCQV